MDLENTNLQVLNDEFKELKQKLYFIENNLFLMNSKMETIYKNTVLINTNMEKQNKINNSIINQILYFTQCIFNYFFNVFKS